MSSNIELRANTWYANLIIPKDVRPVLGKFKFLKSLETSNKKQACLRAAPLVALWKAQIDEARGSIGAVDNEALRWRGYLANAQGVELDVLEENLLDKAKEIQREKGVDKAGDFYQIALGKRTPLNLDYNKWVKQISLVAKTKDQTIKDVDVFLNRFSSIESVTRQEIKKWIDEIQGTGKSIGTANRLLISARNYWRYLQQQDVVGVDNEPLNLRGLIPTAKKKSKNGWIPFEPASIVKLWNEANRKEDPELADLIFIGSYMGARIEEICAMKLENITELSFKIVDAKTIAGIREVPIHSQLETVVKRLKDSSKDGYLITGLSFNKYGDRSNGLGKRFGRLKTDLGFSSNHVFHSIRKTFVTQLENAGVSEGVTADIVGHEKRTMTYGLYSGGNSLIVKAEAIKNVKYNFDTQVFSPKVHSLSY